MPPKDAQQLLAAWRREGGVWYVRLIVEGYEGSFEYVYPGRLSRTFAVKCAKLDCAQGLGEKLKYIHLQEAELRG